MELPFEAHGHPPAVQSARQRSATAGAGTGRLRALQILRAGTLAILLAGCSSGAPFDLGGSGGATTTPTVQEPWDTKAFASDEPYRMGVEQFNRGAYGQAARYFREAVEKSPKDAASWVGLAASYDRLGRFDLADQAYAAAIKLTGETTQILNNQGYSYLLRGNLAAARAKFLKAAQREPNNPTIVNNLNLLNGSQRYIQRPPGQ